MLRSLWLSRVSGLRRKVKQDLTHQLGIYLTAATVTRKDNTIVENLNVHVQDDTAEATLGLWGTSAATPSHLATSNNAGTDSEAQVATEGWKAGETVLLLQAPGWKIGRSVGNSNPPLSLVVD